MLTKEEIMKLFEQRADIIRKVIKLKKKAPDKFCFGIDGDKEIHLVRDFYCEVVDTLGVETHLIPDWSKNYAYSYFKINLKDGEYEVFSLIGKGDKE